VKSGVLHCLRHMLGFYGMLQVDLVGRSSRLVLLWKSENGVEVKNFSQRHISVDITNHESNFSWTFTGFYGHLDQTLCEDSWKLLAHLGL
jgi:hypothetical protein